MNICHSSCRWRAPLNLLPGPTQRECILWRSDLIRRPETDAGRTGGTRQIIYRRRFAIGSHRLGQVKFCEARSPGLRSRSLRRISMRGRVWPLNINGARSIYRIYRRSSTLCCRRFVFKKKKKRKYEINCQNFISDFFPVTISDALRRG